MCIQVALWILLALHHPSAAHYSNSFGQSCRNLLDLQGRFRGNLKWAHHEPTITVEEMKAAPKCCILRGDDDLFWWSQCQQFEMNCQMLRLINSFLVMPGEFGPRPLPLALWFVVALVLLRECSAEALTATCKELHVSSLAKMATDLCNMSEPLNSMQWL